MRNARDIKWYHIFILGIIIRIVFIVLCWLIVLITQFHAMGFIQTLDKMIQSTDARWYIELAKQWYAMTENGQHYFVVYFPLYPLLIKYIMCYGFNPLISSYIVSILSFSGGLTYLYYLTKIDFGDRVAILTIIFISIFPVSFFFGAPMTESVFLLTSAGCLYHIRTHKWLYAGIFGILASMTRSLGIILVGIALIELILFYWPNKKEIIKKSVYLLLYPIGLSIYLYINYKYTGDAFKFVYYQRTHWSTHAQAFWTTFIYQIKAIKFSTADLVNRALHIHIPNIIAMLFALFTIIYGAIKKSPLYLLIYAITYSIMAYAMSWLLSGSRYTLLCLPLFIYLAKFADKSKARFVVISTISIILLVVYFSAFLRGKFVY